MAEKGYYPRHVIQLLLKRRPVCVDCGRNDAPSWALLHHSKPERRRALCRDCSEHTVHAECKECVTVFRAGIIAKCPECGGRYLRAVAKTTG